MNFSLVELQYFCTVAEMGNMSSAARALHVSQPALSQSIKKMEASLGVTLFHRGKKGVTLTRAGDILLLRSRDLTRSWEQLKDAISADENEIRGTYTLGVHGTIATYILPQFYPDLLLNNPNVELRLMHDLSRNVTDGVVHFKMDFGIVATPSRHPDLIIIPLYRDEFKFWIGENPSPLTDCTSPQGVIACNPRLARTEALVSEATRKEFIKGARILHTTELELIANLTAHGHAVGILPATIALGRPGPPLLPLEDAPSFKEEICLIYRHDAITSKASKLVKEHIIACLKDKHPSRIANRS